MLLQGLPFAALFSLAAFSYQRSLHPLYGSVPTQLYLTPVVAASLLLGTLAPAPAFSTTAYNAAIWLFITPRIARHAALWSTKLDDPVKGPVVVHALVLAPLMVMSASLVKRLSKDRKAAYSAGATHIFAILSGIELWSRYKPLVAMDDQSILLALGGVFLAIWYVKAPSASPPASNPAPDTDVKKEKGAITARAASVVPVDMMKIVTLALALAAPVLSYSNPITLRKPLSTPYTHPTQPVRILSSVQSTTGVIVVGESLKRSEHAPPLDPADPYAVIQEARYLRADHSILGGVWIGSKAQSMDGKNAVATDAAGTPLGDSIYSTFVLQEAARFVRSTNPKTALTIGLGAGISTQAFQRHGLNTTIVEIDPAVYEAARRYFGLADPGPGHVFLEDARGWVITQKHEVAEKVKAGTVADYDLFDIVVHDCFSGGGVPGHIFTLEFWRDLRAIMSPEGVLAVNYAGPPASNSARAILTTLKQVYGACRVFHDHQGDLTNEQMKTEFINMVIFCWPPVEPIVFRKTGPVDFLNSHLRRHMLSSFESREVDQNIILQADTISPNSANSEKQWVLTDSHNPLTRWQEEGALEHWKVMKTVLPDVFWETY